MDKNFLTSVFGEADGCVYEYIGQIPNDIESEPVDVATHVTLEFLEGHKNNLLATRVFQFPHLNNRIYLYAKTETDINQSDKFIFIADLTPDPIVEQVEEIPVEVAPTEEPTESNQPNTEPTDNPEEGQ